MRVVTWVSVLVLIAGIAAFGTVSLSRNDNSTASPAAGTAGGETVDQNGELPEPTKPNVADVPPAARQTAAAFVDGAVARNDLAKAWTLLHPDFKRECGCTRAKWMTGNIPVQFFPALGADRTAFGVNEISPGVVVLELLLTPKQGSGLKPTAFYVGMKSVGKGENQKWLVNYFAPMGSPPVPQLG